MGLNVLLRGWALALLLIAEAATATIDGTFLLVRDSDGSTPKKNATVTISFKPGAGGVSMSAIQPGETVTDTGSYSLSGNNITIRFREMEWESNRQGYTFDGCVLTLPFKALSGSPGPGTSTWLKQTPKCAQTSATALTSAKTAATGSSPSPTSRPTGARPAPATNKPTCERCDYVPCIKAMIAQKEKLRDIYGRLANKYGKFYFSTANDGTRVPVATIDRAVWDRSSGGRLEGFSDLLKIIGIFQKDIETYTAEARAPTECGIDPNQTLEISTHQINCETKAAPEVEAALPCKELWHSAVRHEALHSQECETRKTAGENRGPIYLTPYGIAKEEMAAYAQEIEELTQLLRRAENTCWFTCRCGGKKYPTAKACQDNCKIGLRCPVSAANSCMAPDGPDGKPAPILNPRRTIRIAPLR